MNDMIDTSEIEFELGQLADLIAHAHTRLKAEKPVDIAGLPGRTETVCIRIAQLPREDAVKMEPRMVAIVEELDSLAGDIAAQQKSLNDLLDRFEGDAPDAPTEGSTS